MNQTIIIGHNSTFSKKTNKIAWYFNGFLSITLGVFQMIREKEDTFGYVLAILLILAGLYAILYAILGLSKKSTFAPKIKLSEKAILIKNSFWKAGDEIRWDNITSVEFKPYQINFQLINSIYTFDYETNSETSLEIKQAIRAFAAISSIEVKGG